MLTSAPEIAAVIDAQTNLILEMLISYRKVTTLLFWNLNNGERLNGKAHPLTKEECVSHVQKRLGTAMLIIGGK